MGAAPKRPKVFATKADALDWLVAKYRGRYTIHRAGDTRVVFQVDPGGDREAVFAARGKDLDYALAALFAKLGEEYAVDAPDQAGKPGPDETPAPECPDPT